MDERLQSPSVTPRHSDQQQQLKEPISGTPTESDEINRRAVASPVLHQQGTAALPPASTASSSTPHQTHAHTRPPLHPHHSLQHHHQQEIILASTSFQQHHTLPRRSIPSDGSGGDETDEDTITGGPQVHWLMSGSDSETADHSQQHTLNFHSAEASRVPSPHAGQSTATTTQHTAASTRAPTAIDGDDDDDVQVVMTRVNAVRKSPLVGAWNVAGNKQQQQQQFHPPQQQSPPRQENSPPVFLQPYQSASGQHIGRPISPGSSDSEGFTPGSSMVRASIDDDLTAIGEVIDKPMRIRQPHPTLNASWWSMLTYRWIAPLLDIGQKRQITLDDIPEPHPMECASLQLTELETSIAIVEERRRKKMIAFQQKQKLSTASTAIPTSDYVEDLEAKESISSPSGISNMYKDSNYPFSSSPTLSPKNTGMNGAGGGGLNGKRAESDADSSSRPSSSTQTKYGFSLLSALWKQFGSRYLSAQLFLIPYSLCKIIQPLILYQLVTWLGEENPSLVYGYVYAGILGITSIGIAIFLHQHFERQLRLGIDIRISINALIYKKALSLKTSYMMRTTTGQMVNLISNDANKAEELLPYAPYLFWNTPVECAAVVAILYYIIGIAAFAGFAAIVCFSPLQGWFATLFSKYRRSTMSRTDLRVKMIHEMLVGGDVMKMMNWEKNLEEKIKEVREDEFNAICSAAELKAINKAAFFVSLSVVNLLCFATMHFRNVTFTPANVFTTISFFNVLKYPVTHYVPTAVEKLMEAKIAYQRISKFLALDTSLANEEAKHQRLFEEVRRLNMEVMEEARQDKSGSYDVGSIHMNEASFCWTLSDDLDVVRTGASRAASRAGSPAASPLGSPVGSPASMMSMQGKKQYPRGSVKLPNFAPLDHDPSAVTVEMSQMSPSTSTNTARQGLQYLDICIAPGTLVGIIGGVGSYKSSLLAACLGEMTQVSGGALTQGRISYAGQTAWIFAGTIRENILFGRSFDPVRYMRVLRSCQLMEDLKGFAFGDQTAVGEKGTNLSGGQRARLGLARAVYDEADIYLFDDPLAALDSVVAKRVYEQVLGTTGMLVGKTRLLVTHQTHLLTKAHIILLDTGRIISQGSFEKLVSEGYLREEHRLENLKSSVHSHRRQTDRTSRRRRTERTNSIAAHQPETNQLRNSIMTAETSVQGNLDWSVFVKMFRAGGGLLYAFFVFGLVAVTQAVGIYSDKWLAQWSSKSAESQRDDMNAWIYIGLVVMTVFLGILRSRVFFFFILNASRKMHNDMLHAVMYSSMRFFESNPVGRILNRFAKEVSIFDEILPLTFFDFIQCCAIVLGALVVIGMSTPYVLIAVAPTIPLFLYVRQRFICTNRELKRMDSTTRSPIYAHFESTLSGLMIIRSTKSEASFQKVFNTKLDENSTGYLLNIMAGRWFGLRADMLAASVVLALGIIIVATRGSLSPANAGFALSYCLLLTSLFQLAVRQSAEVEASMTAVERICEYRELPAEGTLINPDYRPSKGWPSSGKIEFKDYKMRYRPGTDLILKGVNLTIMPGEKVGVCGRTGAGKSSLFQSLLRLVEADSGSIEIDGLELGKLGLSDLRSNLAIIPQYPVIFSGTLRYNLDPFDRCTDDAILSALDAVQLKQMALSLRDGLYEEMSEFGSNFSVGECQLICVARAILKQSRILLIDEATANVDQKTDQLIQTVIREKFADRTVVTIAHRLNTILECQKIVVMSGGRVAEVGSPQELLARPPVDPARNPDATQGLFAFMAVQRKHEFA